MSAPFIRVVCVDKSLSHVWDVGSLDWVPMTQPGGGSGGGGDASAANQTTEIAALGATTDAEATGNGSIIAVLKRIRTLLGGALQVTGTFWQSVQPVSGTFWQSVQPVSGTFWQSVQPVSGTVTANAGTGAFGVSGTVTANLGTLNGAATDSTLSTMSGKLPASVGQKAMSASLAVVIASDQGAVPTTKQPTGGTNVLKTGTITTTAVTADQVVLTYTVTAAKTFYLTYVVMYGRLTALSATASILGAISLETPSGTKTITFDDVNPTTSELEFNPLVFSEPIPIAASTVVRVVVTPAAATSMLWRANFGGYEK